MYSVRTADGSNEDQIRGDDEPKFLNFFKDLREQYIEKKSKSGKSKANNNMMINGNENANVLSPSAVSSSAGSRIITSSPQPSITTPANGFEGTKLLFPNFLNDKKKRFEMSKNQEVLHFLSFLCFFFFFKTRD